MPRMHHARIRQPLTQCANHGRALALNHNVRCEGHELLEIIGKETIVPLAGVEEVDGDLRLPHHRQTFDTAPDVDPDIELSEEQETVLVDHWGRGWAPPSGRETDDAMTRSEEEVDFGKRTVRKAERVRIKKVLVEDEVTKTVPVRREVIQLETDPPPEGRIESTEYLDEDQRS